MNHACKNCESLSFWAADYQLPTKEPLKENLKADVCIIGAGIVGITCGYVLAKLGKKVVIIDGDTVGGRQTPRTTGHLANALDDHFHELEKLFDKKGSKLAAESHAEAISFIERTCQEEGISCNFEYVDAYLFTPPNDSPEVLFKELEAAKRAGLDVELVDRAPIDFDTGKAIKFAKQAQFHPLKYLAGLCQAIEKHGGKIFTHTFAEEMIDGMPAKTKTSQGFIIESALGIIVATNTPINNRVIMHTKQAAYRTYVIGAKIPKSSFPRILLYDTPDPYHYVRMAVNKEGEEYLLVGGEDHRTGENNHPGQCYINLENWTKERFPFIEEITFRWSGQIFEPVDSLAFIGLNPFCEHIYLATGDSGNGLTHGTLAAKLIADLILKQDNPWKELYDPSRKNIKACSEFITENLNTLLQYGDWLTAHASKGEPYEKNSGIILQDKLKKIAVYKDEEGKIHQLSAICPHLAGIVRWNPAEKTWDCPCHGSRFSPHGQVISGPANKDLKPHS